MANEKRLIDANALLEKIQFRIEPQGIVGETVRDMVEKTREIIMDEPTVDAEEVIYGHWVSDEGDVLFHCSECETQISTSWDYDDLNWNYCPSCGASMG